MLKKVIAVAEQVKEYMTIFNAAMKAYQVFVNELKNPSFENEKNENEQ